MAIIECRHCGKLLHYERISDLPWFPFCSEKCKLIDLGKWFDEEHRIPGDEPPPMSDDEAQP